MHRRQITVLLLLKAMPTRVVQDGVLRDKERDADNGTNSGGVWAPSSSGAAGRMRQRVRCTVSYLPACWVQEPGEMRAAARVHTH